jgi:ribosomal protein S25
MSEKEEKLSVVKKTIKLGRKYGRVKQVNITRRDAFIPSNLEKEIKKEIMELKTITPTILSMKYDVRVSTAKKLLEKYKEEGLLILKRSTPKFKVYIPA